MILPLGRNLLPDGLCELGLSDDLFSGWRSFGDAKRFRFRFDERIRASGRSSLLAEMEGPNRFPDGAIDLPAYGDYGNAANDGAGPSSATAHTAFPVTGGKRYALRLYYRGEGLQTEVQKAGRPERGYGAAFLTVEWLNEGNRCIGIDRWVRLEHDSGDWKVLDNVGKFDNNENDIGHPVAAPADAVAGRIRLRLVNNTSGPATRLWLDQMEIVEYPAAARFDWRDTDGD